MATLTIRNIDDAVHQTIRDRAAKNARSMEEEVRQILLRECDRASKDVQRATTMDIALLLHQKLKGFHELEDIDGASDEPLGEPRLFWE